jgi:hypothetical protein
MKYQINVKETFYGYINVEAESAEEALDKAGVEYWSGNVEMDGGVDFEVEELS